MRVFRCLIVAMAIALPAPAAWAQDPAVPPVVVVPSPPDPATLLDDIVVDGTIGQQAERFTTEAARPVDGRSLARWRGPVCIGVINFRPDTAYQIADGLAHTGGALGVPVADGDCAPNILIIGADDARAVASGWVARGYREFRPNIASATLSRDRLADFETADRAVRWWAISRPAYFDIVSGRALLTNGPRSARRLPIHARSQQAARGRDDLQRLVIILDVGKVGAVAPENLIAYLSVVAFAQIDMRADMRAFDTILNLFDEDYSGTGLTRWDEAYIQSLYAAPRDLRIDRARQASGLAARLREDDDAP